MAQVSRQAESLVNEYAEIEALAEEILTEKRQIVNGDGKRNKCREATRAVERGEGSKYWVCLGNAYFVKMEASNCIKMLNKEQETVTQEIDRLRENLKPKVSRLHQMEGRAECKGFDLKGIKLEDILISKN